MDRAKTGRSAQAPLLGAKGRILAFALDGELYGMDMGTITELIGIAGVEPCGSESGFVTGLIRMRGKTLPVVDLRGRLGRTPLKAPFYGTVVVIRLGTVEVGIPVDDVVDILDRGDDEADWVSKSGEVTPLDPGKLFTGEEIACLEARGR